MNPTDASTIILPTWDLLITLMMIVGVGYGIVMQRERILSTLIGVYIGMAVAQNWGPKVYDFFTGDTVILNQLWIKLNASPFSIKAAIFALVVISLTVKSDFAKSIKQSSSPLSGLMVIAYSFLTTTLAISAVLSFLPKAQLNAILERSNLADFIISNFNLWIILPVLAMVIGAWFVNKNQSASED
jgi:hypothetical protein